MNFKNTLLTTLAIMFSLILAAQEEEAAPEPTFGVSGSVDTYFRGTQYAPYTSFANLPGFAMGMANIIMSYEGEKSGFVADLVFGPRGADAVFAAPMLDPFYRSSNIVNQLYAYYNLSDSFTLTMGNFNTFLGYEVISPVANFNYSTSYMFSYGPFSHSGIKADIAAGENTSIMAAILNSTDMTEMQDLTPSGDIAGYMFGLQLGLYGQYINYLGGGELGVSHIDFTGGLDLFDGFFLGVNATSYSDDFNEFSGIALYPQYAFSDSFSLGLRVESFKTDGPGLDADTDNTSFTITGSFTSGNFIFKPEFRSDTAGMPIYNDGSATDSLSSFLIAAIYAF
tara:strand:+ start:185 stop:1201 length:1017 start_codon:yes stop_codon:yes gene_type:complete